MAGEDGLELGNTVDVGQLYTAEESVVDVRGVIFIAVAAGLDS
jgi:hypothetical protein